MTKLEGSVQEKTLSLKHYFEFKCHFLEFKLETIFSISLFSLAIYLKLF